MRIRLAGYAVLISWACNTAGEFICRLIWGAGERRPELCILTAPVYLLTYLIFVMPLVGCCRAALQLRFWYLLVLASFAWATLACSLVFRASLREMLSPWPAPLGLIWFSECAMVTATIYLVLLRSAVRRAYGVPRSNLLT